MPSITHQGLVEMFRARPALAIELLRDALHVDVPAVERIDAVETSLDEMVPTEHRADLVLTLRRTRRDAVSGVVIVEVQLGRDPDKPWTWPHYIAWLRARYRCPVWLLVVAPFDEIATWAATPIELAPGMGAITPRVLGPGMVPWVTDVMTARSNPELALLSAAAHGADEKALSILDVLPVALARLPRTMLPGYLAMLYTLLAPALRKRLEELMTTAPFADAELPPFIQKILDRGHERGLKQGLKAGRKAGREEGRIEARATALLELLELRNVPVSDEIRAEITACRDLPTLEHWFRRAAKLKTASAVVRSRPKPTT